MVHIYEYMAMDFASQPLKGDLVVSSCLLERCIMVKEKSIHMYRTCKLL